MLKLPDVTLSCVYTIAHEATIQALAKCLEHISFGDIKLYSDQCRRNVFHVDPFVSFDDFSNFSNYEVPKYIRTSHVLSFEWDSWIINPYAWTDEFLEYDYIGAPWWYKDGLNVGNSGFCLRSAKLMNFLSNNREKFSFDPTVPYDVALCRHYRPRLEIHGFKWAPDRLAFRFSQERIYAPLVSSFGFHGLFNIPKVLSPCEWQRWKDVAGDYIKSKPEWQEVVHV